MEQSERLIFLINELKSEDNRYANVVIPKGYEDQVRLLRSLMNVRMPERISEKFLGVQDEFLSNLLKVKGIFRISDIPTVSEEFPLSSLPFKDKISIWQGDITRLEADAIVNAANSGMIGCFAPCHNCIDNAIHSAAGIQLREECHHLISQQGHDEKTGKAKMTKAYNLPCKYVIHTVGPIVQSGLTKELEDDLGSCYRSCLKCAVENKIRTIAFCCISTGEYRFPNEKAAKIAIDTVTQFLKENGSDIDRVVFNVFKDIDVEIYKKFVES